MTERWAPNVAELSSDGALTLLVGWRRGRRIDAGRVEIDTAVEDFLRTVAAAHLRSLADMEAKDYSVESAIERREEYMLVRPAQLPASNGILDSLASHDCS